MSTKLQELTEKIYQEGINKAKEEAHNILTQAREEANLILAQAKQEGDEIIAKAGKESEALRRNTHNELQLAARQAVSDLKQKIASLIEVRTIKPQTQESFKDVAFIKDIITTLVSNWNPKSGEPVSLEIILPKDQQDAFIEFFKLKAGELLDNKLEISYSDKLKTGFKMGPSQGGYTITFTDEDFYNFFQAYLRPKLIELLFGSKS